MNVFVMSVKDFVVKEIVFSSLCLVSSNIAFYLFKLIIKTTFDFCPTCLLEGEARRNTYKKVTMFTTTGKQSNTVANALLRSQQPACLLYTSPSPRDGLLSRMPSSA